MSITAPLVVAGSVAGAAALVLVRDPRSSTYLPCPIHAVTGLWCPGCGATRAFGDLVRGDVASAMSSNVLAVVLMVVGAALWVMWVSGRPIRIARAPIWLFVLAVAVVVGFTVLRNVPAGSWLAP